MHTIEYDHRGGVDGPRDRGNEWMPVGMPECHLERLTLVEVAGPSPAGRIESRNATAGSCAVILDLAVV